MFNLVAPRQTVIVTCRHRVKARFSGSEEEKDNAITLDWHMPCSFDPMLYAIAVGKTRYSCKLIRESGVFVVNFIPKTMEKEALYVGRHSGEHHDKIKDSGLVLHDADTIDCGRIKGIIGYLECEVINEVEAGDHIIFVAKVTNSHTENITKRLFHLEGNNFTTTIN